jgi:hypothetical protein
MTSPAFQELHDSQGKLVGVFISAEVWSEIGAKVKEMLPQKKSGEAKPLKEPMHDWDQLCKYWDFRYPLALDVHCGQCGQKTENWMEDEPRKFRLLAANLGGLASFECCRCHARINKKHFKDKVTVETMPDCGCACLGGK